MSEYEPTVNRRIFVAALAKCVSPMDSASAVNAMMAFLPELQHIPESVFDNPQRLAADLAWDWERVPTLGRLAKALQARTPRISSSSPELDAAPLTAEERAHAAIWLRHRAANDLPERSMRAHLGLIRRVAPAAYRWLTERDLTAAEIAVKLGWSEENPGLDWKDAETVRAAAERNAGDRLALALLRGLVARWAPEHLHLIPPDGPPDRGEEPPPAGPTPRPLSPEQLRAAYERDASPVSNPRREAAAVARPSRPLIPANA